MKSQALEHYGTIQPHMAVCGKDLDNISCYHVIVDTVILNFESITSAADFLFKFFHITSTSYSSVCLNTWTFFHHYVYKMKKSKFSSSAVDAVKSLSTSLNSIEERYKTHIEKPHEIIIESQPPMEVDDANVNNVISIPDDGQFICPGAVSNLQKEFEISF